MNERREFIALVPLVNFNSDSDLIRLDDVLCLRRISHSELDGLIKKALGYEFMLQNVLEDVEYVIEKKMTAKGHPWTEESRYVCDLVLALSLLKNDYVYTPTAFLLDSLGTSYAISKTSPVNVRFDVPYFLQNKEIKAFIKLWRKLQNVRKEKPYLEFPLNQLSETLDFQSYPGYNLLKYMLAFEAIVFHRGTEASKPYGRTIGIAIGMLIGNNEKERTEIERNLKRAYEIRDKLAHGHLRKKLHEYRDIYRVESKVHEYLRRTLIRFLEE